eukprot:TRINITY_DN2559_c0_g6_i1.p1 TRINITY_DN2559_c0_g6~~TRINITY_DN2559_c0_g6_i1.p1  ORF type:complete len:708 (+),score=98.36 TRINITY_DN2559_c0_g6_i1:76-2199(+)
MRIERVSTLGSQCYGWNESTSFKELEFVIKELGVGEEAVPTVSKIAWEVAGHPSVGISVTIVDVEGLTDSCIVTDGIVLKVPHDVGTMSHKGMVKTILSTATSGSFKKQLPDPGTAVVFTTEKSSSTDITIEPRHVKDLRDCLRNTTNHGMFITSGVLLGCDVTVYGSEKICMVANPRARSNKSKVTIIIPDKWLETVTAKNVKAAIQYAGFVRRRASFVSAIESSFAYRDARPSMDYTVKRIDRLKKIDVVNLADEPLPSISSYLDLLLVPPPPFPFTEFFVTNQSCIEIHVQPTSPASGTMDSGSSIGNCQVTDLSIFCKECQVGYDIRDMDEALLTFSWLISTMAGRSEQFAVQCGHPGYQAAFTFARENQGVVTLTRRDNVEFGKRMQRSHPSQQKFLENELLEFKKTNPSEELLAKAESNKRHYDTGILDTPTYYSILNDLIRRSWPVVGPPAPVLLATDLPVTVLVREGEPSSYLSSALSMKPLSNSTFKHEVNGVTVAIVYPLQFRELRSRLCISDVGFVMSLSRCRRSGNGYVTGDGALFVEKISGKQYSAFKKMAKGYFKHLEDNPQTLLENIVSVCKIDETAFKVTPFSSSQTQNLAVLPAPERRRSDLAGQPPFISLLPKLHKELFSILDSDISFLAGMGSQGYSLSACCDKDLPSDEIELILGDFLRTPSGFLSGSQSPQLYKEKLRGHAKAYFV